MILALISTTAAAGVARHLPHAELVAKYMQDARYKETLARCKTRPMSAPAASDGPQLECWAANAASDLQNYPEAVRKFVLDGASLDAALTRCQTRSMEQRFKSTECMNAGRADTFIGLRQPRTIETLKPLTADDFKFGPKKNKNGEPGATQH